MGPGPTTCTQAPKNARGRLARAQAAGEHILLPPGINEAAGGSSSNEAAYARCAATANRPDQSATQALMADGRRCAGTRSQRPRLAALETHFANLFPVFQELLLSQSGPHASHCICVMPTHDTHADSCRRHLDALGDHRCACAALRPRPSLRACGHGRPSRQRSSAHKQELSPDEVSERKRHQACAKVR